VFRALITRLPAVAAPATAEHREAVRPYVEALLMVREKARLRRDFVTSDAVRDQLARAGVEARDTPGGAEWELR
jgi:cysteinyl-tRNA synthetase